MDIKTQVSVDIARGREQVFAQATTPGTLPRIFRGKGPIPGVKAVELAQSERPDLILLDVMMPEMDGYEVMERLRARDATRAIPVIFVTARVTDEDEQHGLSLGAADYITKPFSPAILLARIRNHLQLKRAQDALRDHNANLEASVTERTAALRAVLDSADQLIAMISPEGGILAINRIGAEQFRATPAKLSGRNLFDLLPPEFGIPVSDQIAEVIGLHQKLGRKQAMQGAAEMLRLVPQTRVAVIERCSGHGEIAVASEDLVHQLVQDRVPEGFPPAREADPLWAGLRLAPLGRQRHGGLFRLWATNIDVSNFQPWEPGKSYTTSDRVYHNGRIYANATGSTKTSGTIPPTHEEGSRWDGKEGTNVQWAFESSFYGIAVVTAFTSSTIVTATVLQRLPVSLATKACTRWAEGAWNGLRKWPGALCFYQDRLVAAGKMGPVIAVFPDTGINIWGQKTLQSQPSAAPASQLAFRSASTLAQRSGSLLYGA